MTRDMNSFRSTPGVTESGVRSHLTSASTLANRSQGWSFADYLMIRTVAALDFVMRIVLSSSFT